MTDHTIRRRVRRGLSLVELMVAMTGVSMVLATTAAIERPTDKTAPIFVVTGSEISRKSPYAKGERKDTGAEMATCKLSLLVLDFSGVKSAAGSTPKGGSEAPPGSQGGIPPGVSAPAGISAPGMSRRSATRGDSPEAEQ